MRRFVLGLFAAIGIIASLTVLGIGSLAWYLIDRRPLLPDGIVLTADLNHGLAPGASRDALSEVVFGDRPISLNVVPVGVASLMNPVQAAP